MIDPTIIRTIVENRDDVKAGTADADDILEDIEVRVQGMSPEELESNVSNPMTADARAIFTSTLRQYSPAIDGKKPAPPACDCLPDCCACRCNDCLSGNHVEQQAEFITWAPQFLSVEDPPIDYLTNEIFPPGVMALWHGWPRTKKTWAAEDAGVSLATGTPAFGLDRFSVREPLRVLYMSQEDGARLVRQRVRALLKGRGIDRFPDTLGFAVHAGVDLESSEWHRRLIHDVDRHKIRLIIFDPIRRFSVNADKGPAEVRAITAYLRTLCTDTGVTILIVHHDVKPPQNGQDNRSRGHRASGGDWFAACECPISFELAGEQTIAYPESFKISSDPESFTFTLETDDPRNPTTARLIGKSTTSAEAVDIATDTAVMAYLATHPGSSQRSIMKALRKGGDTIASALDRMFKSDVADCVDLGRGKGKRWTLRGGVPGVL